MPLLANSRLVNDAIARLVLRADGRMHSGEALSCHDVYVDNTGITITEVAATTTLLDDTKKHVDATGLRTHEDHVTDAQIDVLGCTLDGTKKETMVSNARWWRIYLAFGRFCGGNESADVVWRCWWAIVPLSAYSIDKLSAFGMRHTSSFLVITVSLIYYGIQHIKRYGLKEV